MTRIAFVGKAGTGKTTAALHLVNKYDFRRMAMADKLKEICSDLWPEQFSGGVKPRKLLQEIGTNRLRAYDPDVWVNYLVRKVDEADAIFGSIGLSWVVDDCRFLNEARILKEHGFVIAKIVGPQRIEMPEGTATHISEVEQDQIVPDFIISNEYVGEGSFERFYGEIDNRLESLLHP